MTRIDMTTREWHELTAPVIPHAVADKDVPELDAIRIEITRRIVYAVATDRYTLAAERHPLKPADHVYDPVAPVHIRASDAAVALKLFTFSKDADPELRITVDTVAIPISAAGRPASVNRLAITLEDPGGTRLVLHDHRDPSSDPLASWHKLLAKPMGRDLSHAAPAVSLPAAQLPRWAKAVRRGERLAVFTGEQDNDPLLILVEDHFAGLWKPASYLDSAPKMLAESPWQDELYEPDAEATG